MSLAVKLNIKHREHSLRARTSASLARYERAQRTLAGGVSSGMRRAARPYPLYFRRGEGAVAEDVDGNRYIDYGLAWGPLILGQSPPEVVRAIQQQAALGLTFGAQHDLEFEVSERLARIIPCADTVCFANSGTEIVQVALRMARAYTGRAKFLKFEGHYHGWDDSTLVSYHPSSKEISEHGSGPVGAGRGQRSHDDVIVVQWNDRAGVERAFAEQGDEISAVICEPLLCNSGCIPAEPGFLEFLRDITRARGALLIFDEVITGFRIALSGAQGRYGVTPDLATYAKAIGGGLPLSALAGPHEFMQWIADGRVVHAGTLNGNPIVLAAARATLDVLADNHGAVYNDLEKRGSRLRTGLESRLRRAGYQVVTSGEAAVFHVSLMERPARTYRDLLAADTASYSDFALALLDEGVMVLPDGRWYTSVAHTDEQIDVTLAAVDRVLGERE